MNFFKSNKKDELVLVFDVGSSTVGGALFHLRSSGSPKIILSEFEHICIEKDLDPEKLLEDTLHALKKVAGKICMRGLGAPARIFCILSSPWYASQTRVVRFEKNTPFVFTERLADEIIKKEVALFEEEHIARHGSNAEKIKVLELKNMSTILNGYKTYKPIGQKAQEVEMTLFVSAGEEFILKKIASAINQHFGHKDIHFSSFIMSSFTVARDMFVNQDDFLLINIGGEVTDVSMVKKEVLVDTISFPMGRNYVIRGIADELRSSLSDAISNLILYKEGHMSSALKDQFEKAVGNLKVIWLRKLQESLSELSSQISIPATIFITVDQDLSSFFSEIIRTEQFSQYTLTESKFRVIFLSTEALHGIADFEENINRDPFVIIESIYINRFLA